MEQVSQHPAIPTRGHRIWPLTVVALGFGLTEAWVGILIYARVVVAELFL